MGRLFVYGSLQPGESNAHVLADFEGTWEPASVRGRLAAFGWGSGMGYPGLILDPEADTVTGMVLTSDALDARWHELDRFEGLDYERVACRVETPDGRVDAQVYVVRGG